MRTTLPRKSAGTASALPPAHPRDDLVGRRRAPLREGDRSVAGHDVDRALDALAVVFERVIRPGDRPVGIGQQGKIEAQLGGVRVVSVHPGGVHAEGLDAGSLELGHLVAHGGRWGPRGAAGAPPSGFARSQPAPPLIASPSRCAMRVSRCSTAGEWLGCRTSSPSSPCSWNDRIWLSLPCSPRWAASASAPTPWTRSVTWRSSGSGFSTYAGRPRPR